MYDLVSIGDVTIDLFFKGDTLTQKMGRFHLAIGGKYEIDTFHESLGGGGANVAVGCSKHGLNTALVAYVGENPFKQMILQKLVKQGVSCEHLLYTRDHVNISCILLTPQGERTVIHHATHEKEEFRFDEYVQKHVSSATAVFMGNLPGVSIYTRRKILSHFKNKEAFVCLSLGLLDCAMKLKKLRALIMCADMLILNTYEFAQLIGKKKEVINLEKNCAVYLGPTYKNKLLVITDGKQGSYLYHEGTIFFQKALSPEKIIDTTGAGDAYVSGFLVAYLNHHDLKKAMREGALYASKIISQIGAQ